MDNDELHDDLEEALRRTLNNLKALALSNMFEIANKEANFESDHDEEDCENCAIMDNCPIYALKNKSKSNEMRVSDGVKLIIPKKEDSQENKQSKWKSV